MKQRQNISLPTTALSFPECYIHYKQINLFTYLLHKNAFNALSDSAG